MKLAFSNPCRNKSASHSLSRTSVLRPGTAFIWRALTRMTTNKPSSRLKTGRQYTPVLSIATCVQPWAPSQSASTNKSSVMVAKVRVCFCPPLIRQATTVFACTSKPQQQRYKTSIPELLPTTEGEPQDDKISDACFPYREQ